jgi:hypothetical protein
VIRHQSKVFAGDSLVQVKKKEVKKIEGFDTLRAGNIKTIT